MAPRAHAQTTLQGERAPLNEVATTLDSTGAGKPTLIQGRGPLKRRRVIHALENTCRQNQRLPPRSGDSARRLTVAPRAAVKCALPGQCMWTVRALPEPHAPHGPQSNRKAYSGRRACANGQNPARHQS